MTKTSRDHREFSPIEEEVGDPVTLAKVTSKAALNAGGRLVIQMTTSGLLNNTVVWLLNNTLRQTLWWRCCNPVNWRTAPNLFF